MANDSKVRKSHELKLARKLTQIASKMIKSSLVSASKVINSSVPERALRGFKLIGEDDYADALYDANLNMFGTEYANTQKRINKASAGYRRKLKITELSEDQKASAARYVGQEYKTLADTLASKKWAESLTLAKTTIAQGITEGWGMEPTNEYRFEDGSEATYYDSTKYPSQVSKVQTSPGLRSELARVLTAKSNPEAVARTEITRAFSDGVVKGGQDDDFVKGYEFLGVNDDRQTTICRYLNGTRIDKLDPRVGSITPALHVACRSRLIEIMVTDNINANIDTKTVNIDGKTHNIADIDTRFGKAGTGAKAFDRTIAKQDRKDAGIPDNGLLVRKAVDVRKDFVEGKPQPDLVKLSGGVGVKKPVPVGYKEPEKPSGGQVVTKHDNPESYRQELIEAVESSQEPIAVKVREIDNNIKTIKDKSESEFKRLENKEIKRFEFYSKESKRKESIKKLIDEKNGLGEEFASFQRTVLKEKSNKYNSSDFKQVKWNDYEVQAKELLEMIPKNINTPDIYNVKVANTGFLGFGNGSGSYIRGINEIQINGKKGQYGSTFVHEFGHHITSQVDGFTAKQSAFYNKRTFGEDISEFKGYTSGKVFGRRDDFSKLGGQGGGSVYAGRDYQRGGNPEIDSDTPEVSSIGIENIYKNPLQAAKNDPEWFNLIISGMKGLNVDS